MHFDNEQYRKHEIQRPKTQLNNHRVLLMYMYCTVALEWARCSCKISLKSIDRSRRDALTSVVQTVRQGDSFIPPILCFWGYYNK